MIFVDKKKISSIMINPYCFPDVDECSLNTHDCDAHAICTNTEGSFTCKCDLNSHHIGDGKTCTPHRKLSFFHVFIYKQLFYMEGDKFDNRSFLVCGRSIRKQYTYGISSTDLAQNNNFCLFVLSIILILLFSKNIQLSFKCF